MNLGPSFNVDAFRATFDKRLGEIITDVLGDDRIQKLFEESGGHPSEYEGIPTGDIAFKLLDKGVLTQDTKTALLVAQAAERTARLADKAIDLDIQADTLIDKGQKIDTAEVGVIAFNDPVFKFVGSDRDPKILQQAQATWQISQINFNQNVFSVNDRMDSKYAVGNHLATDITDAYGLKKAAAGYYAQAALMLEKEGHTAAAAKMQTAADSIQASIPQGQYPTPDKVAYSISWNEGRSIQNVSMIVGEGYYRSPEGFEDTLKRLQDLTKKNDNGGSPSAEPTDEPVVKV